MLPVKPTSFLFPFRTVSTYLVLLDVSGTCHCHSVGCTLPLLCCSWIWAQGYRLNGFKCWCSDECRKGKSYGFCRLRVLSIVALGSKYYIAVCVFARAIYYHISQPGKLTIACKFARVFITTLHSLGGYSSCNAVFAVLEAASPRTRFTMGLLSREISSRLMSEYFLRELSQATPLCVCTVPLLIRAPVILDQATSQMLHFNLVTCEYLIFNAAIVHLWGGGCWDFNLLVRPDISELQRNILSSYMKPNGPSPHIIHWLILWSKAKHITRWSHMLMCVWLLCL